MNFTPRQGRISLKVFRFGQETNRRRNGRFPVSGLQLATAGFEGSVLDLGRMGMRIETSTSLPIGQSCSVRLRYQSEEATIEGTVQWCRLARTIAHSVRHQGITYHVGVAFTAISTSCENGLFRKLHPASPDRSGIQKSMAQTLKCPNCRLVNPAEAVRCDCGYDFSAGYHKAS